MTDITQVVVLVGSGRTLHMNCGAVPRTREFKGMCNVRPDPTNTDIPGEHDS